MWYERGSGGPRLCRGRRRAPQPHEGLGRVGNGGPLQVNEGRGCRARAGGRIYHQSCTEGEEIRGAMRVARLQCVLPGMPTSLCCALSRVSYHGRWAGRTGSAGLPSAARARDGTPRYEKVQQHRGDYQQGGSSARPVLPPAIIRGVQQDLAPRLRAISCPSNPDDSPSLQRARPPSAAPRRAGNGTVSGAGWRASLTRPLRQLIGIVGAAPDGP